MFVVATATAQNDSLPKTRKPLYLSGLRLGADATPLSYGFLKQEYLGYSGSLELIFSRSWLVVLEAGRGDYAYNGLSNRHTLKAQGQFFNLGVEYNLLNSREDMALIGVRLARSYFGQSVKYLSSDTIWSGGVVSRQISEQALNATWLELSGGLRVKIVSNLYLANSLRVKARISNSESQQLSVFSIPGFGSAGVAVKGSWQVSLMYFIWKKKKNRASNSH